MPGLKPFKFPKLGNPPSYKAFVAAIAEMKVPKRTLAVVDKDTVDADYERQLRLLPSLDDKSFRRLLDEVGSHER